MPISLDYAVRSNWFLMALLALLFTVAATGLIATNALFAMAVIVPLLAVMLVSRLTRAHAKTQTQSREREFEVTKGSTIKIVATFGSQWGRIRHRDETRDDFFNTAVRDESVESIALEVSQAVELKGLPDNVTGSNAEQGVPDSDVTSEDERPS